MGWVPLAMGTLARLAGLCHSSLGFLHMHLLAYLQEWTKGKSNIFAAEGYAVLVSPVLGEEEKARYVELEGNSLLARATLWQNGLLELEALNQLSETVIQASRAALTPAELDDNLNWWLSEIAIYVPPETWPPDRDITECR